MVDCGRWTDVAAGGATHTPDQTQRGCSALILAARNGQSLCVSLLDNAGAERDLEDNVRFFVYFYIHAIATMFSPATYLLSRCIACLLLPSMVGLHCLMREPAATAQS
jgi:hypothetical protein